MKVLFLAFALFVGMAFSEKFVGMVEENEGLYYLNLGEDDSDELVKLESKEASLADYVDMQVEVVGDLKKGGDERVLVVKSVSEISEEEEEESTED